MSGTVWSTRNDTGGTRHSDDGEPCEMPNHCRIKSSRSRLLAGYDSLEFLELLEFLDLLDFLAFLNSADDS